jgi:hypothetical protein
VISFVIPIKAASTANLREHWSAKARRAKAHRNAARLKCPAWPGPALVRVTLTRIGIRELDGDNLQGALKAVRDGVADRLRIDDGSPLIRFVYAQEKGEPGVRVEINVTPHD